MRARLEIRGTETRKRHSLVDGLAIPDPVTVLIELQFQSFERANIVNLFELISKLVDDVYAEGFDLLRSNEFKQFDDSRVKQVVASIVGLKCSNDRSKQIAADDVPIVKIVFQSNDLSEESQRTCVERREEINRSECVE